MSANGCLDCHLAGRDVPLVKARLLAFPLQARSVSRNGDGLGRMIGGSLGTRPSLFPRRDQTDGRKATPGYLSQSANGFRGKGSGRSREPVSRVLYPDLIGTVTIYLASRRESSPDRSGRRCRRGQAANPGTSRALIVPLFGLAPGGVWPPLRHRSRPGALTARFHPYPDGRQALRAVCFCATFRLPRRTDPLRKPGRYPAPCPVEPGLSSPKSTGRSPGPQGLLNQSSIGP